MQLADQLGILVINEIPAVGLDFEDDEELTATRLTQCLRQLNELIARDKNHPSTIMWSVANEPLAGPALGLSQPAPAAVAAGLAFFQRLSNEARRLDGTRPVTMVGVQGGPTDWHGPFDAIVVADVFEEHACVLGRCTAGIEHDSRDGDVAAMRWNSEIGKRLSFALGNRDASRCRR